MTSHVSLTFPPYASHRFTKMYKLWLLMIENIKVNAKNTKYINANVYIVTQPLPW